MSTYDTEAYRMGIEFEYQLQALEDGRPLHWRQLDFEMLKGVIDRSNAVSNDYMAVKYPGSAQRSTYLEGFDFTDEDGEVLDLHVKGVEISTPVAGDVWGQQEHLVRQYTELQRLLADVGLRGVPYGGHSSLEEYVGPRGQRSIEGWASAETAMMTWGIHINVSFPDDVEAQLDRELVEAAFERFAPALVLLSANTPVRGGGEWVVDGVVGPSERSFRRSFTRRPMYFRDEQHNRKEVTCFDITNRLDLIRGYTSIVAGLALHGGEVDRQPVTVTDHNLRLTSVRGYDASLIDRHFRPVEPDALVVEALERAEKGLQSYGLETASLQPLRDLAARRRTPADDTLELWRSSRDWPTFLQAQADLVGT